MEEIPQSARFLVIQSSNGDNIAISMKESIWASSNNGTERLEKFYEESPGPIYLFFTLFGSGKYCGVARMTSPPNQGAKRGNWSGGLRWGKGFTLEWINKTKSIIIPKLIRLLNDTHEITDHKLGVQLMKEFHGITAPVKKEIPSQKDITFFFKKREVSIDEYEESSKKFKHE